MTEAPIDLLVVLPVYNEQASLKKVVTEWFLELQNWTDRFVLLAINDGSTDGSLDILQRLRERLGPQLEIVDRDNRGHGQSCLEGYRIACERGIPFVFQIDSDGQCDPQYFFRFWRVREQYEVIYGNRKHRDDGRRRALATMVLKVALLACCRVRCVDANVPFRLMSTKACRKTIESIPEDFFLANVALAVLLRKNRAMRHAAVPIRFRERFGGEPSVPFSDFARRAVELVRQLRRLDTGASEGD
jgi:glycosyltransferase involved in cell wall biosynthesis